jgi:primosomal protein N'
MQIGRYKLIEIKSIAEDKSPFLRLLILYINRKNDKGREISNELLEKIKKKIWKKKVLYYLKQKGFASYLIP